MPTVDAYRRSPLVAPAFVPLPDSSVQAGGLLADIIGKVLKLADVTAMSPLDAVLASKLGGYLSLPTIPDVGAAALQQNPVAFIQLARAALMSATAAQNRQAMLHLLDAMRTFEATLPSLPENEVLLIGADALRLTDELYRRTGHSSLLTTIEHLRTQLPDVSGLMHSFPFAHAYSPEKSPPSELLDYHRRMNSLATGKLTADALAMTALLALFSGSTRDGTAARTGLASLLRYHGTPGGGFTADPYLAGRDPARAADLAAICAQAEAYADILSATGDLAFAEQLELLLHNALSDLVAAQGLRSMQPVNRLAQDESCLYAPAEPADVSALLRALYALRRSMWAVREADEIALLLPQPGGCITRFSGVPVRLTAQSMDSSSSLTISIEAKTPVSFTLLLRIPAYVSGAFVSVNGGAAQEAAAGTLFPLQREFCTGDTVSLQLITAPRLVTGYRGSLSVLCGATLMALPVPDANASWQYALVDGAPLTASQQDDLLCVHATATDASSWVSKKGFITPPPQGLLAGAEYELTLVPFAGTTGRIAQFPRAARRT